MGAQVIHDDDVVWYQRWDKHLFDVSPEDRRIGDAVDRHDGIKAVAGQGSQDGDVAPEVLGYGIVNPRSVPGTAVTPGHGDVAA